MSHCTAVGRSRFLRTASTATIHIAWPSQTPAPGTAHRWDEDGEEPERMTKDSSPTAASDPQAANWGGLSWSGWHDFDDAHCHGLIPATPGIYRFRARGEAGLLYIGESGATRSALAPGRPRTGTQAPPTQFLPRLASGRSHQAPTSTPLSRSILSAVRGRRMSC